MQRWAGNKTPESFVINLIPIWKGKRGLTSEIHAL